MDPTNYFLNTDFNGATLSERITQAQFQSDVAETLRVAMQSDINMRSLVKDLSQYTDQDQLKGSIREIISAARKSGGDPAELKRLLDNYPDLEDGASALDKAYAKVVKAAATLSEDALDSAVENAIEKKAMSNAYRIATTEINRAYNQGVFERASDDEDCLAMEVNLSSAENNCDDCIDLAETDNGAGPGIYDMDDVPELPIHPHCRCLLTPVYKLPEGVDEEDIDTGNHEYDTMEEMD